MLRTWVAACVTIGLMVGSVCAVTIETVPVGNPGNAGELSGELVYPRRICGSVSYTYNIGKYEVTAGQYTAFLNAVAGVDTYGLYNTNMWSSNYGCKIERFAGSGTVGNPYQYRVAADWANRPVNFVSWGDAARFTNWLHNNQPTGAQCMATTEDGAYFMNGATSDAALLAVTREADWKWAITSEDEWYKAAYHKNDGVTGNYFNYATGSDTYPSNYRREPDPGNNANFWYYRRGYYETGYTIYAPYYRNEVGEFENSDSPYGTFDQNGNVWEWNEAVTSDNSSVLRRGMRGGSFANGDDYTMHANGRTFGGLPSQESQAGGFRVVQLPEPAALMFLAGAAMLGLKKRR